MGMLRTVTAAATVLAFAVAAHGQDGPAPAAGEPTATEEGLSMEITAVEVTAQPMVYVSARTSMDSAKIGQAINAAFETLGKFFGEAQVVPSGPPLAVYSNWTDNKMTVDVGFPVSAADAQKARGSVLAGSTPSGHALKAIYRGPYDSLTQTYDAIGARMQSAGIAQSGVAWEVYLGEPGVTPDADLVTEIYMQISAEDAAKWPAK